VRGATLTGPTLRANLASRIAGRFARTDAKIRALTREGRFSVISDLTREGRFSAKVASLTGPLKRTREGCARICPRTNPTSGRLPVRDAKA
jgi:hypothetical protein